MIKLLRSKKGFTLVEIMIVVAIIGLLAAIAIPNFIKSRNRSRDAVCTNNMKQIASALEQVCMENNLSAVSTGDITWNAGPAADGWGIVGAASYIKSAPTCPIDATNDYTAEGNTNGAFEIACPNGATGEGHGATFVAAQPFILGGGAVEEAEEVEEPTP